MFSSSLHRLQLKAINFKCFWEYFFVEEGTVAISNQLGIFTTSKKSFTIQIFKCFFNLKFLGVSNVYQFWYNGDKDQKIAVLHWKLFRKKLENGRERFALLLWKCSVLASFQLILENPLHFSIFLLKNFLEEKNILWSQNLEIFSTLFQVKEFMGCQHVKSATQCKQTMRTSIKVFQVLTRLLLFQ